MHERIRADVGDRTHPGALPGPKPMIEATQSRHGVLRGRLDPAARLIWFFEKAGWVSDVRWPDVARLAAERVATV